jgi:signal transduction histidine kinase
VLALLLVQSALIAGLLIQGAKRRQAEAQLRGSEARLRTSYDRMRDLSRRLLGAQEAERLRIARELHDDISQPISLLAADLKLRGGPGRDRGEAAIDLAGVALDRAQTIARNVHELSHRLHPAKLRLIGLVAALSGLQRELSRDDIEITFAHDAVPAALPQDLTSCLFRVVQEGLRNAVTHSAARTVSVHLTGRDRMLALTIVDDGTGFDGGSVGGKGLGLLSMHERLEAIGGTLTIHSKAGAGTRLEIIVPLREAQTVETVA